MRSLDQQAILAITLAVIFMINPTGLLSRVRSWVQTDSFLLAAYSLKISTLNVTVGLWRERMPQKLFPTFFNISDALMQNRKNMQENKISIWPFGSKVHTF